MGKTRVRNPEAFRNAREKEKKERQRRLDQAVNQIREKLGEEALNGETIRGQTIEDIAWQLRSRGSLGQHDTKKAVQDDYQTLAEDALLLARERGVIDIVKDSLCLKVVLLDRPTVPRRIWRKYENIKYSPHLLEIDQLDHADLICDVSSDRFRHLKGTHRRILKDHH